MMGLVGLVGSGVLGLLRACGYTGLFFLPDAFCPSCLWCLGEVQCGRRLCAVCASRTPLTVVLLPCFCCLCRACHPQRVMHAIM
jgi:hypothetical protein